MAKKVKIGGSYVNLETGMIESSSGTGLGSRVSSVIQKIRDFIKNLFPRRRSQYFSRSSYFDRFRDWLLDVLDHFSESILPTSMWIIWLIATILALIDAGFITAAIVAAVGLIITPIAIVVVSLICKVISFFIGKILYSKTTLILTILLSVGAYFWMTGKDVNLWNRINFASEVDDSSSVECVVYSDVANIRTSPSNSSNNNIQTGVPFGYKMLQINQYNAEWYKFKYKNADRYIHASVVVPASDFELLNELLRKDNNLKKINLVKYRKSLLEYFKNNRYLSSGIPKTDVWNIARCATGTNVHKQEINIQGKKFEILGIIIENISSGQRKVVAFTFKPNNDVLENTYEWNVSDKRGIRTISVSNNKPYILFQDIVSKNSNNVNTSTNNTNTQPAQSSAQYIGERNAKGEPHGMGTYILTNGDKFEATWVNGVADGYGTYTSTQGWEYIGTIKNSEFDGIGTIYYKDGTSKTSKWKNGKNMGPV